MIIEAPGGLLDDAAPDERIRVEVEEEAEDLEVVEVPLGEAPRMTACGEIVDGKTSMLLQHAALRGPAR